MEKFVNLIGSGVQSADEGKHGVQINTDAADMIWLTPEQMEKVAEQLVEFAQQCREFEMDMAEVAASL